MHSHPLLKKVYEDVYRPTLPADHRPADRTGLNRELASAQTRLVTAICGRAAYAFKAIAKALRVLVFVMGEKSDAQGLKVVRNILGVAFGQEAMQALLEEGDDDDDDPLAATGARPSKAPRAAKAKAKAAGDDAGADDNDADDEDENDDGDAEGDGDLDGDADEDEDEHEEGEHVATGGDRRKGLRGPRKAPDLVNVTPAMAVIIAARKGDYAAATAAAAAARASPVANADAPAALAPVTDADVAAAAAAAAAGLAAVPDFETMLMAVAARTGRVLDAAEAARKREQDMCDAQLVASVNGQPRPVPTRQQPHPARARPRCSRRRQAGGRGLGTASPSHSHRAPTSGTPRPRRCCSCRCGTRAFNKSMRMRRRAYFFHAGADRSRTSAERRARP